LTKLSQSFTPTYRLDQPIMVELGFEKKFEDFCSRSFGKEVILSFFRGYFVVYSGTHFYLIPQTTASHSNLCLLYFKSSDDVAIYGIFLHTLSYYAGQCSPSYRHEYSFPRVLDDFRSSFSRLKFPTSPKPGMLLIATERYGFPLGSGTPSHKIFFRPDSSPGKRRPSPTKKRE